MTRLVVDASAALAWLLPDQANARTRGFVSELDSHDLYAPAIFEWEVLNVLSHRRRRRLSEAGYRQALDDLAAFEIEVEPAVEPGDLLELAHAHRLSLFDSAYLEAALEQDAAVVSRDRALIAACAVARIAAYDLSDGEGA